MIVIAEAFLSMNNLLHRPSFLQELHVCRKETDFGMLTAQQQRELLLNQHNLWLQQQQAKVLLQKPFLIHSLIIKTERHTFYIMYLLMYLIN